MACLALFYANKISFHWKEGIKATSFVAVLPLLLSGIPSNLSPQLFHENILLYLAKTGVEGDSQNLSEGCASAVLYFLVLWC